MIPTARNISSTASTIPSRRRVAPLLLLFFTTALLLMDTSLINLLIEPIRRDLNFSDSELALLQGAFPTIAYAVCAIPVGLLVDRVNRTRMIMLALVLWTIALILIVAAPNFAILAVAKVIIGAVQAVLVTAPFSLIADLTSQRRRSMAVSALIIGQAFGTGLGFVLGGTVFTAFSEVSETNSWRLTILVFGALGLVLVPFYILFREPARTERGIADGRARASFQELGAQARIIWPLFAGYGLLVVAASGLEIWGAPALIRLYDLSVFAVGNIAGIVTLAGMMLGALFAGWMMGRARQRNRDGAATIIVGALALTAATLFAVLPSLTYAIVLFAVGMIANGMIATSVPSFLMLRLPNELRGLAGGTLIVLAIGPGLSLGPSLIALASSQLGGEDHALGSAIAIVGIPAGLIAAALFVLLAFRTRLKKTPSEVRAIDAESSASPVSLGPTQMDGQP